MRRINLAQYEALKAFGTDLTEQDVQGIFGRKANMQEIEAALLREGKLRFKTIPSLAKCRVGDFIDLENYLVDENFEAFVKLYLNKNNLESFYIEDLKAVLLKYRKESEALKERFPNVYNPQSYGLPGEQTQGSELRREFAEEYTGYMMMLDLICVGDFTKSDQVLDWETDKFLHFAGYLMKRKSIENIK